MRFQGKTAIVTGGARGIGRATASLFAREGATVFIADLLDEEGAATAAGIGATYLHADVTDAVSMQALLAPLPSLDILIVNAGRPYALTTLTADEEDWRECIELNLKSAWICARAAHPLLQRSDSAAIVTVASYQGLRSGRSSFPYSAAKGGLLALTRSLAVEYAPRIRVNAVIPGQIEGVRTAAFFDRYRDPEAARRRVLQTFPLRRLGQPEDVAKAIAFLAGEDAGWITGSFLTVDGGRDAATVDLSDLESKDTESC